MSDEAVANYDDAEAWRGAWGSVGHGSFPAYFGLVARRFRGKNAVFDEWNYSKRRAFHECPHLRLCVAGCARNGRHLCRAFYKFVEGLRSIRLPSRFGDRPAAKKLLAHAQCVTLAVLLHRLRPEVPREHASQSHRLV